MKRVPLFACCFKEKHFVSCDDSSGDPLIFECECVNSTSHVRLNAVHRPENMMRDSQHSQTRCCSGGVGMKKGTKVQTQMLLNCLWDSRDVGEMQTEPSGLST